MRRFFLELGRHNHLACALLGATLIAASCQNDEPGPNARNADVAAAQKQQARQSEPPSDDSPRSAPPPKQKAEQGSPAAKRAPNSDQQKGPEKKRKYVVAALGDSITDKRVGGGGFLRYLRDKCPESTFDNYGKGGDMTNQMRRRFEREVLPQVQERGYDTLIVYGGVNDLYSNETAGRTNERIEQDLSKIYGQSKEAGLEVVAVTVSPWGGFSRYFNEERSQNTRLLNSWILGRPAKGRVDKVVDSYPLLSCGDPEVLCPEYETRSHDGLHPGPKGHEILGKALYKQAFGDCR